MIMGKENNKQKWYDYAFNNKTQLNKTILYLTTMSNNFNIRVTQNNGQITGYIVTEIELNENHINNWYDEIEGGENNMHETIN